MKKIPSLFIRDFETGLVTEQVTPGCEWVIAGEGEATVKLDGTACMIRNGKLYKRYDCKRGKTPPPDFEPCQEPDEVTGHWPGWIPVGPGPGDQWHREAWSDLEPNMSLPIDQYNGTYELCGPKIGGNPERLFDHSLIRHGLWLAPAMPRSYHEIKVFFSDIDIEGVVWHHPDGRMAKCKLRDFGLVRTQRKGWGIA